MAKTIDGLANHKCLLSLSKTLFANGTKASRNSTEPRRMITKLALLDSRTHIPSCSDVSSILDSQSVMSSTVNNAAAAYAPHNLGQING